jgi:hypothetical protein
MGFLRPLKTLLASSNAYPKGKHAGNAGGLTGVEADLVAGNVKLGETIFGVLGTMVTWIYDVLAETGKGAMTIPQIPPIVSTAVEDHSGGSQDSPLVLAMPEPSTITTQVSGGGSAVAGAVQNDEGAGETDETAAANNATANDMHIFPAVSGVTDSYRLGFDAFPDFVVLNIGTAGVGTYTIGVQYWKGASWATLPTLGNEVGDMKATGRKWVWWTNPGDAGLGTFGGIADKYWIQFILTAKTSMTANPLGTQAWGGNLT